MTPNPAVWRAVESAGALDLLGVDLIDEQAGWAVGDLDPKGFAGAIYATADGGRRWAPASRTNEILTSVHFVSRTRGWVAGFAGRIERTDDGGRTWRLQRVDREGEALNSIFFIDERRGWVVGGTGLILRTVDGGDNWERVDAGRVEDLWAVRFASPERGWIVGDDGLVLATADGGATWERQPTGVTRALYGLALGEEVLVAVGEAGTILRSEGGTWRALESPTRESLNAVAAAQNTFWAVGSRGAMARSADDGNTWEAIASLSQRNLLALDLLSPGRGVAVGQRGFVQVLE